jgi:hypothetical protein
MRHGFDDDDDRYQRRRWRSVRDRNRILEGEIGCGLPTLRRSLRRVAISWGLLEAREGLSGRTFVEWRVGGEPFFSPEALACRVAARLQARRRALSAKEGDQRRVLGGERRKRRRPRGRHQLRCEDAKLRKGPFQLGPWSV